MTAAPSKLAVYLRVSTQRQDTDSQLHALKEFCRRHAWKFPAGKLVFAEKVSGKKQNRTQLDLLVTLCRDGHVDTILTYKVDRIGRSHVHLVNLFAEFDRLKIRVVGVADGIDTGNDNASTRLYRNLLISFAESQREGIVENIHSGLAAARKAGTKFGRPPRYTEKVANAWALREGGKLSIRKISAKVGLSVSYLSLLFRGKRGAKQGEGT